MCGTVAAEVRPGDRVLECARGTGLITAAVAGHCGNLVATDYSEGMLKRTRKKCGTYPNVEIRTADILNLPFRVCRLGGKLIIPTYVNKDKAKVFDKTVDKAGADFRQDFILLSN